MIASAFSVRWIISPFGCRVKTCVGHHLTSQWRIVVANNIGQIYAPYLNFLQLHLWEHVKYSVPAKKKKENTICTGTLHFG
jgi:hypothetical protein